MNNSQVYQPVTIKEVYLSSLGFNAPSNTAVDVDDTPLSLTDEDQYSKVLKSWSAFCDEMAAWYMEAFADDPIILIGAPTTEMCVRYQVPARRGFILQTLGRIIENMGSDSFVGIVDCKHDPLTDADLAAKANHWVHEFATVGQMPYPVEHQSRYLTFAN